MAEFTIKLHQADPDDSTTIHDLYPVTKAEAVTFSDGEVLSEVRSYESGSIILSSIWTDTEGVYTQTFTTINSITDCTIVNIDIDPNATEAEREAFYMLDFGEGSQTTTDFTLVCEGDLNTIDIPLVYYCTIIKLALIDDGTAQGLQDQITTHEGNKSNPHTVTASQVGLGNVDNTSDVDKPLSSIAQAEFTNLKTIQTAGGTGTAITLSNVELVDGFQVSFVIALDNARSATTINGKPLYKPGTVAAPNLIAGKACTVWYNLAGDCFFIKASAEGTATADDVLAGKTFSNDDDTGIVGTLDLTNLVAENVKKDVEINGVTGSLPYLPGEYYNERVSFDKLIFESSDNGPSYQSQIDFTLDGDIFFSIGHTTFTINKYNVPNKELTALPSLPTGNKPGNINCNDDGTILYVQDTVTYEIYLFENNAWVGTGLICQGVDNRFGRSFGINPSGSEVYYISPDGTTLNKWAKEEDTTTAIIVTTGLAGGRIGVNWVDDNSVWLYVNANFSNISLIDGATILSTAVSSLVGTCSVDRRAGVQYPASLVYNNGTVIAWKVSNTGIKTAVVNSVGYDAISCDRTGRYVVILNSTYDWLYDFNETSDMLYSLSTNYVKSLTANFNRMMSLQKIRSFYQYS